MPVRQREWIQREWTQPGIDLYREKGDFHSLSALYPDFRGRLLKRAPAWSALVAHAGLTFVRGLFYDERFKRYVLLGKNANQKLSSLYFSSAWVASGVTQLTVDMDLPGGLSMYNHAYFGDELYVIKEKSSVYRCDGYSAVMAVFYNGPPWPWMLAPYGGRLYMITEDGAIYRLNDAGDAFESHLAPVAAFDPLWAGPFRGYLCVVGEHSDGRVGIYRVSVPSATVLHESGFLPPISPTWIAYCSLYALHDDVLYFSPGPYTDASGVYVTQFFTWNGSRVERLTELRDTRAASTIGLTTWRGELIYYELPTGAAQVFKILVGDHFVDFAPLSAVGGNVHKLCAGLGTELVVTGEAADTEGIYHLPTSGSLQDGYLITSRLDMDCPGRQKRLLRLTVLLDGAAVDFDVIIKYRTDDTAAWTTAVTSDDTTRVTVDITTAVTFYTLQVRVDLDDDTGNDEDIRIGAVSVLYSVPD